MNFYDAGNHLQELDGADAEQAQLWSDAADRETDDTTRIKYLMNAAWYAGRAATMEEFGIEEIEAADAPDEEN